jgi:hypothetical protein
MEHHAHVGVECPQCHGRQFVEVQFDQPIELSPLALELRAQLEAWMASRCPDHLSVMPRLNRN